MHSQQNTTLLGHVQRTLDYLHPTAVAYSPSIKVSPTPSSPTVGATRKPRRQRDTLQSKPQNAQVDAGLPDAVIGSFLAQEYQGRSGALPHKLF